MFVFNLFILVEDQTITTITQHNTTMNTQANNTMTAKQVDAKMTHWVNEEMSTLLSVTNNAKFQKFAIGMGEAIDISFNDIRNNPTVFFITAYVKVREIEREDNIEIIKHIIA